MLQAEDLLFDFDDIKKLLEAYNVKATDSEIRSILKESIGYPLGVMITARLMAHKSCVSEGHQISRRYSS